MPLVTLKLLRWREMMLGIKRRLPSLIRLVGIFDASSSTPTIAG